MRCFCVSFQKEETLSLIWAVQSIVERNFSQTLVIIFVVHFLLFLFLIIFYSCFSIYSLSSSRMVVGCVNSLRGGEYLTECNTSHLPQLQTQNTSNVVYTSRKFSPQQIIIPSLAIGLSYYLCYYNMLRTKSPENIIVIR